MIFLIFLIVPLAQAENACLDLFQNYKQNSCKDQPSTEILYPCTEELNQCSVDLAECSSQAATDLLAQNTIGATESICPALLDLCFDQESYKFQCAIDVERLCSAFGPVCPGFQNYTTFLQTFQTDTAILYRNEILQGTSLFNLPAWVNGDPCSDSVNAGVDCNLQGFIVDLNYDITGPGVSIQRLIEIASRFIYLEQLSRTNVDENPLTGSMQSYRTSCLKRLTDFELTDNGGLLTGVIPESLAQLPSLMSVSFNTNGFQGPLPRSFANNTSIESLILSFGTSLSDDVSFLFEDNTQSSFVLSGVNLGGALTTDFCSSPPAFCIITSVAVTCGPVTSTCCLLPCP